MKILLKSHIWDYILKEFGEECESKKIQAAEQYAHYYIQNVYIDYKKKHLEPLEDHDELCMWCNYHAMIFDCCSLKTKLPCTDFDNPDRPDCQVCMQKSIWYKKL
jgi:hypothetical protein